MQLHRRNIFLLDGIGAVVSVLLLGVVLPAIQPWIGMPLKALFLLAIVPVFYGAYSFACYRFADPRNPRWLQAIMVANLLYCVLTASLTVIHFHEMTQLGVAWFIIDGLVIVGVVALEGWVLRPTHTHRDDDATSTGPPPPPESRRPDPS